MEDLEAPISMQKIRQDYPIGALDVLPRFCDPFINGLIETVLGRKAIAYVNEMIREHVGKQAHDFMRGISGSSGLRLEVSDEDRDKIPDKGRVIIASTHPNGLSDLPVCDLIMGTRGDVNFLVSSLVLILLEDAEDACITVPIFTERTSDDRDEIRRQMEAVLQANQALVLFPSGALPRPKHFMRPSHGLVEGPWRSGMIGVAEKTETPIVPVCGEVLNSRLFYALRSLGVFGEILSHLGVFREFARNEGKSVEVKVGDPIDPDELKDKGGETPAEKAQYVRKKTLELVEGMY